MPVPPARCHLRGPRPAAPHLRRAPGPLPLPPPCARVGSVPPEPCVGGGAGVRALPSGSPWLCSRRERQEQLMGYRKRGPKPKPLVVQVTRGCPAPHPRALAVPGELLAASFIMLRSLRAARAPPTPRGPPALSSAPLPSPLGRAAEPLCPCPPGISRLLAGSAAAVPLGPRSQTAD